MTTKKEKKEQKVAKTEAGTEKKMIKETKNLTPYQGSKRTFGMFKCEKCNRTWSSGNSWANMGQQCMQCLKKIYPHHQRKPIKNKAKVEIGKRHLEEFCDMCKNLGHSCVNIKRIHKAGNEK